MTYRIWMTVSLLVLCTAQTAGAAGNCAAMAGLHSGTFTVVKKVVAKNLPESVSGTWSATIDAKTCAMVGTVESEFFGTVKVAGEYGPYKPITNSFDATNVFFQETPRSRFSTFAFGTDKNPPSPQFVNISNSTYSYWGDFKAER